MSGKTKTTTKPLTRNETTASQIAPTPRSVLDYLNSPVVHYTFSEPRRVTANVSLTAENVRQMQFLPDREVTTGGHTRLNVFDCYFLMKFCEQVQFNDRAKIDFDKFPTTLICFYSGPPLLLNGDGLRYYICLEKNEADQRWATHVRTESYISKAGHLVACLLKPQQP